jgi:hypothetical protein
VVRTLRFATWSLFALTVSFTGCASFLLVLGFPEFGQEVFSWAQQCTLMCGACFGLLTLLELENRVRLLEDQLSKRRE